VVKRKNSSSLAIIGVIFTELVTGIKQKAPLLAGLMWGLG
jgi:hypothetical protein